LKRLQGLYLVVDPSTHQQKLLDIVKRALKGGVDILQLWSPSESTCQMTEIASSLLNLANQSHVPLIINNNLQLAKEIGAYGVHMDQYDVTPSEIRKFLGKESIVGYTLGNDLERLKWAENVGADYVSFCAVFPTSSVAQCEIVPLESITLAKSMAKMPVFASGGINLDNARSVLETGADGIAVISAILKARDPEQAAKSFKSIILEYIPQKSQS
jgi:thiamine-phosphate pyrophosphorylase